MNLAINASRARSGGAKAHLIGIISEVEPRDFGFEFVHVWAYSELLEGLPSFPWLIKHTPLATERSIFHQLWWEYFNLPAEVRKHSCSLLFNVDAGSVCYFEPAVTMSRDMLAFEPGEMQRLGYGKLRLRQWLLRRIQCRSLTESTGTIFLTNYASTIIQSICGCAKKSRVIPHGVGSSFRAQKAKILTESTIKSVVRLLYVSPVLPFKHQWNVVRAVQDLRKRGYPVHLKLVGSGINASLSLLNKQLQLSDPNSEYTTYTGEIPHSFLPREMNKADVFIFASSCENMPNTLLEAMSMGLPIACSNRGPMPEVLQDGGLYFDPENSINIADIVELLIADPMLREKLARRAHQIAQQYSWRRCANETFGFLSEVAMHHKY